MARPEKNVVDYFPHQCEHGKSLFILETKYPFKGYVVWFKTLELLGKSNNHFIDCRRKEDWQYLSAYMKLPESELQEIYNTLAELDSIHPELWENKIIWSLNFIKGIKDAYRKRNRFPFNFIEICESLNLNLRKKYTKNGIIDSGNGVNDAGNGVSGGESTQSKVKYSKVNKREKELTPSITPLIPSIIQDPNPNPNPKERENKNIKPIDPKMQEYEEKARLWNLEEERTQPDPERRTHWTAERVKHDEEYTAETIRFLEASEARQAERKKAGLERELPSFEVWTAQEKAKSKKKNNNQDNDEIL